MISRQKGNNGVTWIKKENTNKQDSIIVIYIYVNIN